MGSCEEKSGDEAENSHTKTSLSRSSNSTTASEDSAIRCAIGEKDTHLQIILPSPSPKQSSGRHLGPEKYGRTSISRTSCRDQASLAGAAQPCLRQIPNMARGGLRKVLASEDARSKYKYGLPPSRLLHEHFVGDENKP